MGEGKITIETAALKVAAYDAIWRAATPIWKYTSAFNNAAQSRTTLINS
jgi:hypothetical protein